MWSMDVKCTQSTTLCFFLICGRLAEKCDNRPQMFFFEVWSIGILWSKSTTLHSMNTMEFNCLKIRNIVGVGQKEFADFLGISKSGLSMFELNERPLTNEGWLQFVRLRDSAAGLPVNMALNLPSLDRDEAEALDWTNTRIHKIQTDLSLLDKQIAGMEEEFAAATFVLKFLNHFLEQQSGALTDLQLSYIATWKSRNVLRLVKNGPQKQKQRRAERAALNGELQFLLED